MDTDDKKDPLAMCVDIEAETSLVGSLLIGRPFSKWAAIAASSVESHEWLTAENLRLIYEHLLDEYENGGAYDQDITLMTGLLRDKGILDAVGGVEEIERIACSVPSCVNVEHYALRVREMHFRRETIRALIKASEELSEPSQDEFFGVAERWLAKITAITHERRTGTMMNIAEALQEAESGERQLCKCGITWLDQDIGLALGEYVVIAGRPSMGKSSLVNQIATESAKRGRGAVVFSQEMPPPSWATNTLARESSICGRRLRHPDELDEDEEIRRNMARGRLEVLPVLFCRRSVRGVRQIVNETTRLHQAKGIELVVVDYIQNVPSGRNRKQANENDELTYISRELQALARDLNVCVLVVSQLNRRTGEGDKGVHEPPPGLARLRGSGSIEQDADVAIFVHRPEYYAKGGRQCPLDLMGKAQLLCEKNRNGPVSSCWFSWQPEHFRFRQLQQDAWPNQVAEEEPAIGPME